MDTNVPYSDNNYVKNLNINANINTDIKIDFYNTDETLDKLKSILTDIQEEINKIVILEDFPPYYQLNMEEHECNNYIRNNNIEYMNDETLPLIGCKINNININSYHKTLKTGIIVCYNNKNNINLDVKVIECEHNGEITFYELKKNNAYYDKKINDDDTITFHKSDVKIINGCLPRTLDIGENRFLISKLPTNKISYKPKYIHFYSDGKEKKELRNPLNNKIKCEIQINAPRHYVLDKKLNIQYILNSVDIFELLKQHNEQNPYFEKYEKLNNERHNPSDKIKQLKKALIILIEKKYKIEEMIIDLPKLKEKQGKIYSSSSRTARLKAQLINS